MIRLPILTERTLAEAKAFRSEAADSYHTQVQARLDGATITCRKGCSNCCYHPVLLSILEGVTLFQWLQARGLWSSSLRDKLRSVGDQTKFLAFEVWSYSLIPCPLLDTQTQLCKAYEGRPFACRITYSIGPAENCHPHSLGPGILSKKDLFEGLSVTEKALLSKHHLMNSRLPLAVALLYGEQIAKGEVDLEDYLRLSWEDLLKA